MECWVNEIRNSNFVPIHAFIRNPLLRYSITPVLQFPSPVIDTSLHTGLEGS